MKIFLEHVGRVYNPENPRQYVNSNTNLQDEYELDDQENQENQNNEIEEYPPEFIVTFDNTTIYFDENDDDDEDDQHLNEKEPENEEADFYF